MEKTTSCTIRFGTPAKEVTIPQQYAQYSKTLEGLLEDCQDTLALDLPSISSATWDLICSFIQELLFILPNDMLTRKAIVVPEYDFESLYAERLAFIGKVQGLSLQDFLALVHAVNYLDMPCLYANLLLYYRLESLTIEGFIALPRALQADLLRVKLKATPLTKKNTISCKGHTERITGTAFDKEHRLISQSDDHTLRVWNIRTGEQVALCQGHTSSIIGFFADEDTIISASYDNTVRVWQKSTAQEIAICRLEQRINAFYVCVKKIITATADHLVRIFDVPTGTLLHTCAGNIHEITHVCANENFVASGSRDGTIRVWNIHTGELYRVFNGHKNGVTALAFCNNDIISASEDNTVRIWNAEEQSSLLLLDSSEKPILSITIAHNKLVLHSKKMIFVYNLHELGFLRAKKSIAPLRIPCKHLMRVIVGKTKIIGATRQSHSSTYVWDAESGAEAVRVENDTGIFATWASVSCDEDTNMLVSECETVLYTYDLSILDQMATCPTETLVKVLSYLQGKTTYEKKQYRSTKVLSQDPWQFKEILIDYFKENKRYDWNEIYAIMHTI